MPAVFCKTHWAAFTEWFRNGPELKRKAFTSGAGSRLERVVIFALDVLPTLEILSDDEQR